MKYLELYNEKDFPDDVSLLYGYFYKSKNFEIYNYKNQWYIKNNVLNYTKHYARVDEEELFVDILKTGRKLYNILKNSLDPIYNNGVWLKIPFNSLVNLHVCNYYFKELSPIILEFVNNYNIPICMENVNNANVSNNSISFNEIINTILFIYILNYIYVKLSSGVEKHYSIYNLFSIKKESSNEDILRELSNIFNYSNGMLFGLGTYKTNIIRLDNSYTPFRYTTNLFTFAWEFLQSSFCTLTYKENTDDGVEYLTFSRCANCLSTISEVKEYELSHNSLPQYFKFLCDNCKKKKIANQKLAHDRKIINTYNYIFENKKYIDTSNEKGLSLFKTIIALDTNKDRLRIKELNRIKNELDIYIPIEKRQ